jgi:L-gulono-1,4-lactone dehydrogenase
MQYSPGRRGGAGFTGRRRGPAPADRPEWRNWAGTATATPARWCQPRNEAEISAAVKDAAAARLHVRALGSGHSFTPVAATDGLALDLSGWTGIVAADTRTGTVTVRSGTTLRELNAALGGLGLAMANLGDIDAQTLAGALSTGTHGTGARLGGLATQVEALDLVLADGSLVTCSATTRPELFAAARVGLGALGVITTVTLRCVPSFTLAADERPVPVDEVIEQFDSLAAANDHFEFYWFPYGRNALVKRNNRVAPAGQTPAGAGPPPAAGAGLPPPPRDPVAMPGWRRFWEFEVMENAGFGTLCRIGRAAPRLVPALNRFSSAALSTRSYTDVCHRVFVTPRRVRFVESEYAVPRESVTGVLAELRRAVPRLADPVMFPVEVRVAAADDIWLSTGYGRDTGYIAIHQYVGLPYRAYFETFESIVAGVAGRPHWGKLHSLDAERLRPLYPRFDDFRRVRAEVDPEARFGNSYLTRVLGQNGRDTARLRRGVHTFTAMSVNHYQLMTGSPVPNRA